MSDELYERKSHFAKRVGISPARVTQLLAQGLPVTDDALIPVRMAMSWMKDRLNPVAQAGQPTRGTMLAAKEAAKLETPSPPTAPTSGSLIDFRTRHEAVKVERALIALAREQGEVVAWTEVETALAAWATSERDSWQSWTQRTAPAIASEIKVDGALVLAALRRHVTAHLRSLGDLPHVRS